MPWVLDPVVVAGSAATSGSGFLVSVLRAAIADTKISINNVVMEENDTLSSGGYNETYYTDWMPILSGCDTYFRIGRWAYTSVANEEEASGLRAYIFDQDSGAFWVPSGAICGISGNKAYLSYSWIEEQTYTYQDSELKMYLQDAVSTINNGYYNFGYSTSGIGDTFDVYPNPGINDTASYIYVKYATYLVKKRQEAEGFDNRIYVRDLNVTIDTAKGLGDLSKSANDLLKEVEEITRALKLEDQTMAFQRIDTYSTYVTWSSDDNYAHRWKDDSQVFGT